MKNLFSFKFWLNSRPGMLTAAFTNFFWVFLAVLFILFFVFLFLQRKKNIYRNLYRKLSNFCLGNFIIGLVLLFFIYEAIPFLSARFWLVLWVISMAVWLFFVLKRVKEIPKRKEDLERQKEYKKYIP